MTVHFCSPDVNSIARLLKKLHNDLHEATVADDGYIHRDVSGVYQGSWDNPSSVPLAVTAADAFSLATSKALAKELKGIMLVHFADDESHRVKDETGIALLDGYGKAYPEDLDDVQDLANLLQHVWNAHLEREEDGVKLHMNDDSTNVSTSSEATNQGTANTLLNELKGDVNAHILSGPLASGRIKFL